MTPERAQLCGGWWFPRYDSDWPDFVRINARVPEHPVAPDGRVLYQRHKLLPALDRMGRERRRVAVDVGGHVGMWARQLCEAFDFVHVFEPLDEVARLVKHNVPHPNYELHRAALGAGPARVKMSCSSSLSGDNFVTREPGNTEVVALDSLGLDDVDLIKIDVQGGELGVVLGAADTLRRCRPVVVVEQKGFDARRGDKKHAALKFLNKMGARTFFVSSGDYSLDWPTGE